MKFIGNTLNYFSSFFSITYKTNLYIAVAWRIISVMLLFQLCRMLFFVSNLRLFPSTYLADLPVIFGGGLRFDLSALLYINCLFLFLNLIPFPFRYKANYQKILKHLFLVTNGLAIALNCFDTAYYQFTLRRSTLLVWHEFSGNTNLGNLLYHFVFDYWPMVFAFIAQLWLLSFLYNRVEINPSRIKKPVWYYAFYTTMMFVACYFVVVGMRGGFGRTTRPITLSNAAKYTHTPKEMNIVLNTPFAILRTLNKTVLQPALYFSPEQSKAYYNPVKMPLTTGEMDKKNVVVLIVESFGNEYTGFYNGGRDKHQSYTPFLDSLMSKSLTFKYSLANGRKSVDAIPAVICSIPCIKDPYVLSHYSGNKINTLASLLNKKGYHTSFFHGAPNGSMGFQSLSKLAGYQYYYGKDEYNNNRDFDGVWGIWDHKFLPFFAETLTSFEEPFFASLFTVSSHHPFRVPEDYKNVVKKGSLPIHQAINYTDMSLRSFFKDASKRSWYNNTLFVITADHTSVSVYPENNNEVGVFRIPIVFFDPGNSAITTCKNELAQQIDIMPSVLSYLKYDEPYVAFGRSLFEKEEPFAVNYSNNNYQLFMGSHIMFHNGFKPTMLFDFVKDSLLTNDLLGKLRLKELKMDNKIKAFIQEYNGRMIKDELTVAHR